MKKFGKYILGILVIALLGVGGYIGYTYFEVRNKEPEKLSKRNDDLAFNTDREGHWDIVMINGENELTNLTSTSDAHNFFFNFTFDGTILNFYSTTGDEMQAGVVNADGSDFQAMNYIAAGVLALTTGQINMDPAWSPNGENILWISMRDFNAELYISDSDGSDDKRVTNDGGNDVMEAWSPDGTKIAYVTDKNEKQDVYILDVASGDTTRLTGDEAWDFQPVWSLDGTQILFVSDRDEVLVKGDITLYIIDVETQEVRPFGEDEVFKGDPTYSSDGTQIAYMSNETGFWHIYVMDADESNTRQITEGENNNMFPAWRPIPVTEDEETPEE